MTYADIPVMRGLIAPYSAACPKTRHDRLGLHILPVAKNSRPLTQLHECSGAVVRRRRQVAPAIHLTHGTVTLQQQSRYRQRLYTSLRNNDRYVGRFRTMRLLHYVTFRQLSEMQSSLTGRCVPLGLASRELIVTATLTKQKKEFIISHRSLMMFRVVQ